MFLSTQDQAHKIIERCIDDRGNCYMSSYTVVDTPNNDIFTVSDRQQVRELVKHSLMHVIQQGKRQYRSSNLIEDIQVGPLIDMPLSIQH